jgi:hypothetical protein
VRLLVAVAVLGSVGRAFAGGLIAYDFAGPLMQSDAVVVADALAKPGWYRTVRVLRGIAPDDLTVDDRM